MTAYTWNAPKLCHKKKWLEFITFINNSISPDSERNSINYAEFKNWKEAWNNRSFHGIRAGDLRRDIDEMLYHELSNEATHWERGQFIEFISSRELSHIYFTSFHSLREDMNSINWPRSASHRCSQKSRVRIPLMPWFCQVSFQLLQLENLCISQIEASTSTRPPPGIPRAFNAFPCPGGREFDHHSQGVGNLIAGLDSRWFYVGW